MGIRKKGKEVTAVKRLASLIMAFVFTLSAVCSAPVSFAEDKHISDDTADTAVEEEVSKDTTWFDYKNPKTIYRITTEAQLIGLASLVNEEQTDSWKPNRIETFEETTFILMKDIKMTQPWEPIGAGGASYFAGTFDGNGHTIRNLQIKTSLGDSGFFGYLDGNVKNLTVKGSIDSDDENCGGIAGIAGSASSIINCESEMTISGKEKTGGIVGYNDGGIIGNCTNDGAVSGTYKVGGIAGENWGIIEKCANKGTVTSSVRGVATYGTGGVAGRSVSADAIVRESYNTGDIVSNTEATGGIVGYTNARGSAIENCYNNADIRIDPAGNGRNLSDSYAGGIAGIAGTNGIVVKNCYHVGIIRDADTVGGILGHYINETEDTPGAATEDSINNNYYLNADFDDGIGLVDDEDDPHLNDAAIGISESMLAGLSPSLSFAYTEDTGEYGNDGYPVLDWQQSISDEEKAERLGVSREIQEKLDFFMMKKSENEPFGQIIVDFFIPYNITSNAYILYMNAKENK